MSEERLNELFSIVNEGYSSIQEREIRDYITNLQQENKQLKNILIELEKWSKAIMENVILKRVDNCARKYDLGCLDIEMVMKTYGEVLNKIQELNEK